MTNLTLSRILAAVAVADCAAVLALHENILAIGPGPAPLIVLAALLLAGMVSAWFSGNLCNWNLP